MLKSTVNAIWLWARPVSEEKLWHKRICVVVAREAELNMSHQLSERQLCELAGREVNAIFGGYEEFAEELRTLRLDAEQHAIERAQQLENHQNVMGTPPKYYHRRRNTEQSRPDVEALVLRREKKRGDPPR